GSAGNCGDWLSAGDTRPVWNSLGIRSQQLNSAPFNARRLNRVLCRTARPTSPSSDAGYPKVRGKIERATLHSATRQNGPSRTLIPSRWFAESIAGERIETAG